MESKLIIIWGAEPKAGRKTLAVELAAQLAREDEKVLLVRTDPLGSVSKDLAAWIPRFKALSPVMLKNFLKGASASYAQLDLTAYPPTSLAPDLVGLLRRAFDWIIWTAPVEWSPEALSILDHSDLLLWVAGPAKTSQQNLKNHFEQLASLHYPNAFSQVVLNQGFPTQTKSGHPLEGVSGKSALAVIPQESPRGFLFRQSTQQLVEVLKTRSELYLPHVASSSTSSKASPDTIVEDIKNRIKPQLIEAMGTSQQVGRDTPPPQAAEIAQKTLESCMAEDATIANSREQREEIFSQVMNEVLGLGPLEPLLKDPSVSEVMVNGKGSIFVEKKGKLHATGVQFSSDAQLRTAIDRIVAPIGRRVDESMPLCDARLPDGSRVNIVIPPLALEGPTITIRKFMSKALSLQELVQFQSMSGAMAEFLRACILLRKNIVVAGGTGSGKTTLLNALSSLIPDDERIVTIEDAAELRLQKPHVVRLESRPPNAEGEGAIPIRRLVINALRMRPDRIVVGECRGGEALDMLQAMNTGHDGSLTTLHANSPRDALRRLETLVLMAGLNLPLRVVREQIQSAVDILIQQSRMPDGTRKVTSITEVTGMEGETLTIQELFRFQEGRFENTGIIPTFSQDITRLP